MFGKWLKVLAEVVTIVPVAKKLWYTVKKDVPRVTCPNCEGKGKVWIRARPDKTPDKLDTLVPCPLCNGTGKVRKTDIPEDMKKKEA